MKKKFLALVLTLAMVLSLVPVTALATGATQPNIQNPGPCEDGYVKLEKRAAAVPGRDNTFDITLKATVTDGKEEGPKTSTDAVLVIDRSGSMKSEENGDRITPAQNAAKDFASVVLGKGANPQNRIAVVSYEESATTNTELSSDLETVKNAINFDAEGGTNIQAGIKAARDILKNSTANNKVILVLSDGEPTYSFQAVGTATQTGCYILGKHWDWSGSIDSDSVKITGFNYEDTVGNGRSYTNTGEAELDVNCEHNILETKYYKAYQNHGQPTIQEASYAKEAGCEIYSIYLGDATDTNAVSTMKGIATDNDHYKLAKDASELGKLFKGIADDIILSVIPGMVTDPMGDHMNLVTDSLQNNSAVTTNDGGFTWDLTKVRPVSNADGDGSRTYELTYRITFNTDFDGFDADHFYPTNQTTTLAYTVSGKQKIAEFPIPEVKGKAVTYQLTYNANGGNQDSVPTDGMPYTKNATADLDYNTKPTHAPDNGKNVIFIGWSATNDNKKIYDKGDTIPTLIQSVEMDSDKTVYAIWGYDAIGEGDTPDGVPDVFNAVVTYKIEHGTWADNSAEKTEVIQVKEFKNGVWTDTGNKLTKVPSTEASAVRPSSGFTTNGAWSNPAPTDNPVVKSDTIYIYTLEAEPLAPTYTLTYDANGGYFGSDTTVESKAEQIASTGNYNLKYTDEYTPTHAQSGDKNVIFLGWSAEKLDVLDSTSNAAENAAKIITSVDVTDKGTTVYAVWGLDEDGHGIPDVFEATIIYKIENGQWTNGKEAIGNGNITATFQLYEQQDDHTWKATDKLLRDGNFPAGYTGNIGYTGLGWYRNDETESSELVQPTTEVIRAVTGAQTVFTYKYAPTTSKTYTVVLHLEGGSYATTPDTYTENSDGTYQYNVTKTDAVINPESPSRNNFGFTGWSLSKNAPQTLIGEDANFASLYLEQSGTSGSFDKIDLYAVWKEAEAPAPQWDTSKSKKATNLDSNYESKVTLSLPSAEEKLDSDIVFVLDKSTSVQLKNQALEMLNALKGQADKTGAKIKVGVVIFNKIANVTEWKDLETQYDDIKAAIEQDIQEGTNIHAGLLAAKKMLDEDTDVAANRKYMILVSDGVTYQFCHNSDYEKAWTRSFNGELHADKVNQRGTLTELNIQYDNAETGIPQNSISAWMTDIQNRMNNGKDCEETYDYEYTGNAPTDTSQLLPAKEYVSNVEKALYLTKNTYEELSTSYNCYAILARETRPWGTDFMNLLAGGSTLNFESVQNNILYLVAAGSKVEDYMGYTSDYNFNFINDASKLTITVGRGDAQKKLDAVKIDDNHYGFGPVTVETDSSDKVTTYRYNLEYIPGNMTDTEHFVWRINVPVENLAPVALTYSVKLVNPKSASGTYGQYDVDGSKNYSGLYTNNSATLYPKDSNNNWGIPENFLKPTVSYTVSGGSGGNHKPTVTIPDDVPTGLNGKDHYAYVVGYPDGMVYPQKNITRAEVATIFFRLLTDETREANMTKSNGYNDMKDGAWYTCAVSTLSKMGIIKGYEDGSFKPDASISRAEFAAIAARFDPDGDKTPATFSDVSSHWAKDEISIAANHGWIKGYEDGSFKPDQKITRAETMTLVNRVLKRLPETKDDLHKDMKTWPDNQNESAWFYLAVQEATNSHYQKLKKDGTHETWESMRETRDWAALEK